MIDGAEVQQLDRKSLLEVRKKVGFMFQDGALFDSISLFENLAFPDCTAVTLPNPKRRSGRSCAKNSPKWAWIRN